MRLHQPLSWIVLLLLPAMTTAQERLSLDQAINEALKNNPDIIATRYEIEAAEGRIAQAGRIPNPEIEFSWGEMPSLFKFGEADERDIGIVQSIEFPTKRGHRIDVASLEKRLVELKLERIRVLVASSTKKAYIDLLLSKANLESLRAQRLLLGDFLEVANSRLRTGAGTYLDVIRAKVEMTRVGNELVEAERQIFHARSELNLLIGREGTVSIEPSDSLNAHYVHPDTSIQNLTANSRYLKMAQLTVEKNRSSLSLARSSYLPDFSLGVSHQYRAEEPPFDANNFTGETGSGVGVQLGVSVPVWFWQEPAGQVQEASAFLQTTETRAIVVERKIRASVNESLSAFRSAFAQVRSFEATLLEDAKDILNTGIDQYRSNQIDVLNLLDVYRTHRAAQAEYNRAVANLAKAIADLEAAVELPNEEQ